MQRRRTKKKTSRKSKSLYYPGQRVDMIRKSYLNDILRRAEDSKGYPTPHIEKIVMDMIRRKSNKISKMTPEEIDSPDTQSSDYGISILGSGEEDRNKIHDAIIANIYTVLEKDLGEEVAFYEKWKGYRKGIYYKLGEMIDADSHGGVTSEGIKLPLPGLPEEQTHYMEFLETRAMKESKGIVESSGPSLYDRISGSLFGRGRPSSPNRREVTGNRMGPGRGFYARPPSPSVYDRFSGYSSGLYNRIKNRLGYGQQPRSAPWSATPEPEEKKKKGKKTPVANKRSPTAKVGQAKNKAKKGKKGKKGKKSEKIISRMYDNLDDITVPDDEYEDMHPTLGPRTWSANNPERLIDLLGSDDEPLIPSRPSRPARPPPPSRAALIRARQGDLLDFDPVGRSRSPSPTRSDLRDIDFSPTRRLPDTPTRLNMEKYNGITPEEIADGWASPLSLSYSRKASPKRRRRVVSPPRRRTSPPRRRKASPKRKTSPRKKAKTSPRRRKTRKR